MTLPVSSIGDDVGALPELGDPDLDPECPPAEEISGRSVANLTFPECINAIKHSQRPIMLHFLATLGSVHSDPLMRPQGADARAPPLASADPFAGDFENDVDNPFNPL